jgi:catechol 2,3-dioxygenase-like lactoylglutathione lyase family enzyme
MIVGVHHFAINTSNFDRMLKFYKDAFGFVPCRENFDWSNQPVIDQMIDVPNSAARSVMLKGGNCYIELFEYTAPPSRSTEPLRPFDKGYTHMCVESNDMARDFEHLKACGMDFSGRDWLEMNDVKAIYGYDPEGNIIEIQQCSAESPQRLGLLSLP